VIALGQDAKAPLLAALLLHHRVKTDAAHLVGFFKSKVLP